MTIISKFIDDVIQNIDNDIILTKIRREVEQLCANYPLHMEYNHEMS